MALGAGVEPGWWVELEGPQSDRPIAGDVAHWISVYTELIRALRRMALEAPLDPELAARVADRLQEAESRRQHWIRLGAASRS